MLPGRHRQTRRAADASRGGLRAAPASDGRPRIGPDGHGHVRADRREPAPAGPQRRPGRQLSAVRSLRAPSPGDVGRLDGRGGRAVRRPRRHHPHARVWVSLGPAGLGVRRGSAASAAGPPGVPAPLRRLQRERRAGRAGGRRPGTHLQLLAPGPRSPARVHAPHPRTRVRGRGGVHAVRPAPDPASRRPYPRVADVFGRRPPDQGPPVRHAAGRLAPGQAVRNRPAGALALGLGARDPAPGRPGAREAQSGPGPGGGERPRAHVSAERRFGRAVDLHVSRRLHRVRQLRRPPGRTPGVWPDARPGGGARGVPPRGPPRPLPTHGPARGRAGRRDPPHPRRARYGHGPGSGRGAPRRARRGGAPQHHGLLPRVGTGTVPDALRLAPRRAGRRPARRRVVRHRDVGRRPPPHRSQPDRKRVSGGAAPAPVGAHRRAPSRRRAPVPGPRGHIHDPGRGLVGSPGAPRPP